MYNLIEQTPQLITCFKQICVIEVAFILYIDLR